MKNKIKQLEKKVQELQYILKSIPANFYWKNREGKYQGCSKATLENLQLDSDGELIGKKIHELVNNTERAFMIENNDERVMSENRKLVLEEEAIHLDGQRKTYLSHKAPLHDENGQVVGLIGISVDITEQKERERIKHQRSEQKEREIHKKMEETNTYLTSILTNAPGSIYWKDKEGNMLGCNDEQAKIMGMKKEDIVGKNVYHRAETNQWPTGMADEVRKNDIEVMTSGVTKIFEEIVLHKNERRIFLSQKSPLKTESGETIGVLGIGTDITKLKEIERQLVLSNKIKDDFIANISHDLRTPLSGIIGISEIIQHSAVTQETKQYTECIIDSSTALLKMLNNIIETIQSKDLSEKAVSNEIFKPKELIESVIQLIKPNAFHKYLLLKLYYDERTPEFLLGDAPKLYRILTNLLNNAVKFTHNGSITLTTECHQKNEQEISLKLIIKDTGIGISQKNLSSIFEKFNRLTAAYQGTYEGLGLGLFIVKQYLNLADGDIQVESKLKKGTQFTITIPFKIADNKKDQPTKKNSDNKSYLKNEKPHILLVEDNALIQKATEMNLQSFHCTVDIANDGKQALEKINTHRYDMVLIDIGLPDIKGYKVIKKIRTLSENHNQLIPIVAVTAHAEGVQKDICLKAGANSVIVKPLMKDQMEILLKKFL